jgi:hypothetical protein
MKKLLLLIGFGLAGLVSNGQAALIDFDLRGTAGSGLLPGNEPGSIAGGTGGEIGAGIFFDDITLNLTINVGWGSAFGFTDLSSAANNSHIHGPTAGINGNNGTADFMQTAGVLFNLTRSANVPTGGTIMQSFTLTPAQQTDLYNGKFYINIHTANNGGGELRGFLVVPEPSTLALAALGVSGLVIWRVRRRVV